MFNLKNKKILIFAQRGWGVRIGHFLARKIVAEGGRAAALTLKRSTHKFLLNQKDVNYDLLVNNDAIMDDPLKFLVDDDYSLAKICRDLNIDSVWPLVYTQRQLVRSYKDKFYYGYKQNVPDEIIVAYIKAIYKNIKNIFASFAPDLIIAPNFGDLLHIMFCLYAKKRGVKMMTVTECKVKGVCIFSYNYNDDEGPFFNRVDELNRGEVKSDNRARAKEYLAAFRKKFIAPDQAFPTRQATNFFKKIKAELKPYYQIYQWLAHRQINHLPLLGITTDYRPPRIILRDHYARKRYERYMRRLNYYSLENLSKIVYFPLQFQPEVTIDVLAPFFSNQIEVARQIAMSLPDDYTLVVKEHPEMVGLRPPSYIEKIMRTPNIKMIDYRVKSEEILKRADLLVSINGTSLAEAAFYGKKGIQLGNLGITKKLPNVTTHTHLPSLAEKIKQVLSSEVDPAYYEWKMENYVAAAYDTGFEFNYWGVWDRSDKIDMTPLWQAFRQEIIRVLQK